MNPLAINNHITPYVIKEMARDFRREGICGCILCDTPDAFAIIRSTPLTRDYYYV